MITSKFKDSLDISLLGFGAMRLPQIKKDGKDVIDYEKAREFIEYAYENGVNYFDTAYVYHGGFSEVFLRDALKKYPRESYYIADKLPMWDLKCEEDTERLFNIQLERLGTEYIDFYLMHSLGRYNFDQALKYNVYETLKKLQSQGKIKYIGFSFHDNTDMLTEIVNTYEWDFAQIQLNYLDWETQNAKGQYEILTEKGIPAIIMEPVRGGALANLCEGANEILKGARPDKSIASWAIRYAASLPNVMTVLSGMSDITQVTDNVATISGFEPVTDEEMELIQKAADLYRKRDNIPCTGCAYCMPCPAGVDIPRLFKMYNDYSMNLNMNGFKNEYPKLDDNIKGYNCIKCGACEDLCPQSIEIRAKLDFLEDLCRKQ